MKCCAFSRKVKLHDTIMHLIPHNYISQLTMYKAQGHKQYFVRTRLRTCKPALNLCGAGAAKMKWNITAALEEAKTKNPLYHLSFHEIAACSWLNKRFMFKIRHSPTYKKDFIIIHAVTVGQEVGEQPHWAKHKNMPVMEQMESPWH